MENEKHAKAILNCIEKMKNALELHTELGRPVKGRWKSPPTKLFWKVQAAFRGFDEAANAIMPLFDEHGLSADAKPLFRLSKTMSITPPRNIDDEFIDAQAALQNLFRKITTAAPQSTGGMTEPGKQNEDELNLTPIELSAFRYLKGHADSTVDIGAFYKAVWGKPYHSKHRDCIYRHVGSLRKKLDQWDFHVSGDVIKVTYHALTKN